MKNIKKFIAIAILLVLITAGLSSNISAVSINKNSNDVDENQNLGKIEGKVMYAPLWTFSFPLPLATVKIGLQFDITKSDGYYCIDGLKLNKEYIIVYSHPQYKTKIFPIILTDENPELEMNLYFYDEDYKDIYNKETTRSTEKQTCNLGSVSGSVTIHCFPPVEYIQGAKLVLEGEHISRTTFSGLLGNFRFNFVEVGRQYTLTATHPKFKTFTETFTLSEEEPNLRIGIAMLGKDGSKARTINSDASCGGTIYGYTIESHDTWGAYPVPLALVDAGVKKTISAPVMGTYQITGLPFDQEITITASKIGYKSDTIRYTFTEEKHTYFYSFDLQEKENYPVVKQKGSILFEKLFPLISLGPNARSNFLSTFAFIT